MSRLTGAVPCRASSALLDVALAETAAHVERVVRACPTGGHCRRRRQPGLGRAAEGIGIDADTAPRWRGERLDLSWATRRAVAPAGRRRPRGRRSRGNVRTVTNRRRRTPPSPLRRVRLRPPRALPLSDDAQDPDRQRGRREHGPHHPPDEPSLQVREADAGRGRPPPAASCRATAIVWYVFRCRPRPVGVGTARRGDIFRPGMHFSLDSSRGGGLVRNRQRTRNSPQAVCGGAGPPPRAGTVFSSSGSRPRAQRAVQALEKQHVTMQACLLTPAPSPPLRPRRRPSHPRGTSPNARPCRPPPPPPRPRGSATGSPSSPPASRPPPTSCWS